MEKISNISEIAGDTMKIIIEFVVLGFVALYSPYLIDVLAFVFTSLQNLTSSATEIIKLITAAIVLIIMIERYLQLRRKRHSKNASDKKDK